MIEKLCGEANVDAKDVIIAYLTKQVQELERQLLDASIQIQELTEQDIWCPSNCEKLEKLQQENQELKKRVEEYKKKLMIATKAEIREIDKNIFVGIDYFQDKCISYITQQKEFIKYLEDMLDDENDIFSVVRVKSVLQKYKEIIGGK